MNSSKSRYIYIALIVLASLIVAYSTYSLIVHGSPTSKSVREYLIDGNELHKDSLYEKAMKPYGRAYSIDTLNNISCYNNGTNLILKNYQDVKSGKLETGEVPDSVVFQRYSEAERMLLKAIENMDGKDDKAKANHNLALTYHLRDTLKAAESAYKEALRNDPTNENTRYNLAVVQYLLKNNQNQDQQQQNQDQQQQNQNQNQDQQQNQNQDQQQNQNQDQQQQNQNQQQQQQQQQQKENYERMLEALMQDEKELRDEMKEKNAQGVRMDLEKNW